MEKEDQSNSNAEVECEEELHDCSFLSNSYLPIPIFEETFDFVAAKVAEIEKEIDKLSSLLKEAYYIAIEQEIKQRTNYVKSKKFLLMFLRAESFDATKAALKMANFFKWKLRLFGPEKLPRPIRQEDLNEDDKKVLRCDCFHYSGVDCEGRPILTVQLQPIIEAGLFHERYLKNAHRIGFYVRMCFIEGNEDCQKNGMILIKWGMESALPLKNLPFFISLIKQSEEVTPRKLVAIHDCRPNNFSTSWMAFLSSMAPKHYSSRKVLHIENSTSGCFSALSQYGIDVDSLPGNISGNFGQDILKQLDQLQEKYLSPMSSESDMNEVPLNSRYADEVVEASCEMQLNVSHSGNRLEKENSCDDKNSAVEFHKFSLVLMDILNENKPSNAIFWSHGGSAIAIYKEEFCELVLSKQLGGIKFDSFTRKLKRCGFQRLTYNTAGSNTNSDLIEFAHPLFQKNSHQLLKKRQTREQQGLNSLKFPVKLMNVLENDALSNAIWWVCNGKAFAIEKNRFHPDVLDKYFAGLKLDSFYRMLRKWNFQRLPTKETSSNVVVFQNVLFTKDMPLWALASLKVKMSTPQPNFFEKLYIILGNQQTQDAIWWIDNDTFAINADNFSRDILPYEYNGIKFNSFRRSLVRWKFKQIGLEGKTLTFQHPKLHRDILQSTLQQMV